MLRKIPFLLFMALSFFSCKKENSHAQWDIQVIGPVLHASLGIGELIGDSSIETLSDQAQILNYDTVFSNFNLDSIYQVADTTIPTIVIFPPFASTIQPNTPFYSNNNTIALGVGNVLLKKAIISSGTIRLEIKNTLHSKVNFIYTIPRATKGGIPFTVSASVDSASSTNPKFFTGDYDFSGYDVDMTGLNGNSFNTITYNVEARSEPAPSGHPFDVFPNDTMVNLQTTLIQVKPYFVKGYLGQDETTENSIRNIGIGGLIKNGTIELDSIRLNLDIINYIGADEQAFISAFHSHNNRTGNTVDLIAPSFLQQYLNINRATLSSNPAAPVNPSYYSIQLDHTNSNIREVIENLPDKIDFDFKLKLNPLGNISGSNDFVYKDYLVNTRFRVTMPLRFALNQLTIADTVPFTISNATNFDPVGFTDLTLIVLNSFPFDMNVQLFLLDGNQTVVDSMLVPDFVKSAPVDANYRSIGSQRTEIKIPVDAVRKQKLLDVKRIGIRMKFNTPDYPQLIQMYSGYRVDLKLIADGIYSIR